MPCVALRCCLRLRLGRLCCLTIPAPGLTYLFCAARLIATNKLKLLRIKLHIHDRYILCFSSMVGPGAVRFPCYHTVDSQPPVSENVAGTTKVDFVPLFRDLDTSYGTFELYQNIGFQRPCQDYSLEELRLIDYAQSGAANVTSKQAASGSIENDKAGPGPRKVSPIESLPEELVTEIAQRLGSNDLKSLRLASRRLSKTTFYVFAQCIPSVHFVTLTESGLRSFLPLSRNYDLAGRILTVNLLSPFIVTEDEDSDQEHVCYQDPRLADCPIRIQKNLIRGQSELHIRLLSEILGNLRILRRVRLRAFPVITSREPLGHALAAQYPMSSWAFHCVMAAVQRAANHLPELAFEEVELFSQAACSGKLTKPPPTDISPLAWELEPISGLESLDLRVESTEQCKWLADPSPSRKPTDFVLVDGAIRHPSMFRYMRAILTAAAPGLESLSLTSSDCHQREVLDGILGDGMRMPKLKSLSLRTVRVTFETLKAVLLMHEATLESIEIQACLLQMKDWQVEEICEIVERRDREFFVVHCKGYAPFPSKYAEENKWLFDNR